MEASFGDYSIRGEINRGATAVVYEAEETNAPGWHSTHSRVALKVFNERPGGGFTIPVSTIQQEIKCASSLEHQNIAQLMNVVPHRDRLGLAFELVNGPDLLDYIRRFRSRVPEELAIFYFRQMVAAVQHMHSRQIVHRDLKPENCMIDPDRHILKVIDFGLGVPSSTQCLTGCGTINTIAPECIAVDGLPTVVEHPEAVDIWGLGVTLYIMLSGTYPFQDLERPQCDYSHRRNILRGRPHALPGRISSATRDLVRKILQVNPRCRLTLTQILEHPALENGNPLQSTFDEESRMFSATDGLGSRVPSYISRSSEISPERSRVQSPWLVRQDSLDMDCDSASSPSPPSGMAQGDSGSASPSKEQESGIATSAMLTGFRGSCLVSPSRDWGSFGSLSAKWSPSAQQPSFLLNNTVPSPLNNTVPSQNSLKVLNSCLSPLSPVSIGKFPSQSSFASTSLSLRAIKSSASLASQIELIQAALQDESDQRDLEASGAQRWHDSDYDQADTDFGSEFDMGDKAQICYASNSAGMSASWSPVWSPKVSNTGGSASEMDAFCSLPRSPKNSQDAASPGPVRLFSVSDLDLAASNSTLSQQTPSTAQQGPQSGGQAATSGSVGMGRLKAVPSFQQLSPFKSYLSGIPEEADEVIDEILDPTEDSDKGQSLGIISLSMQSDDTTYDG